MENSLILRTVVSSNFRGLDNFVAHVCPCFCCALVDKKKVKLIYYDMTFIYLMYFAGFHKDAAQWLVDNRKIKGVGIDARSFDHGQTKTYPAHQIFLGNNIYGLESVANIDKLPVKGATVYVMPMKVKGGSGGPTRIIAQTDPAGQSSRQTTSIGVVLLSTLLPIMMLM